MSSQFFDEKFRRPSISFAEMLKKGAAGLYREKDEYAPNMLRALVVASDTQGGKLETPDGVAVGGALVERVVAPNGAITAQYTITPTRGPLNPPNSVRACVLTNNMDQFTDFDNFRTFWPLIPGLGNPSAGELVYVMFEDESMLHGLWVSKVVSDQPDEGANQILMVQQVATLSSNSKRYLFMDTQPAPAKDPTPPTAQPRRDLKGLF